MPGAPLWAVCDVEQAKMAGPAQRVADGGGADAGAIADLLDAGSARAVLAAIRGDDVKHGPFTLREAIPHIRG